MIYLSVIKNESGDWVIIKTITYPINVRGNKTGNTYGDITKLDLDTRRDEGFWTQNDVYLNTGEFMIFKEKTVEFDEVAVEVTNTYIYELMPLADIRNDFRSRVESKRDNLYYSGFEFNGNTFDSGTTSRVNIQLMLSYALNDDANFPNDLQWEAIDGTLVPMDLATFKQFIVALADFTRGLYIKSRQIRSNIESAVTYEDIRAAAKWDNEPL
ncbi:hypothetical protein [Yersinia phage fHe-Yen9-04]|uniref:DUF4376 domain-containing protein n=1 Tax=Yersinia phage fHe-Yen9-04 TaxID=2052742 RepID=A0A2C9CWW4_9CAUD|nr:virion structural protein [Yersinia phage fHe-Yen9-04]SOK58494.1 hypothetical protein [Yersinia phage fHe-Yen9-04]VUE36263.1 hypothetical protein [Yersinia phage fHe-Yen9-04]